MKFKCERENLLSAFQLAATVAPSRSPKAILQNVLLNVTDQDAMLMATDMEVGIRIDVPGIQVELPGRAVLPVGRFAAILRESNDAQLSVETVSQSTVVRGERSEFKLPAENPDEFPEVVGFDEQQYYELPAKLLRELIRRTLFATDTESGRYALGGVLIECEEDKIIAVGTDGRRLAKMEGPVQVVGDRDTSDSATIVPAKSMQLIARSIGDEDGNVQVAARTNDMLVKGAKATIYSRLVDGRFPKWRDVFPTRQDAVQVEIAIGPLNAALRQAAIVTSEDSRGIDFAFGEGTLVLTGSTAEVGESRIELPIAYDGPSITLALDHRFVADFLKVLDAEKVFTFEIENAEAAALLTTDDGYGYVIMPLARDR